MINPTQTRAIENPNRYLGLFLILILLYTPFLSLLDYPITVEGADGDEWLDGWDYRQKVYINGSTSGAVTDYQVPLRVFYESPFAENGVDDPLYTANDPRGVYFNGITYITWQGDSGYDPYIITYNHATELWSDPVKVGTNPLSNDYHGAPSIMLDNESYIHLLFGSHTSPSEYRKSSNPEDISAWDVQADLPGELTYAHPIRDGDDLYVIFRERDGTLQDLVYFKSTDNGGSWGGETEIITVSGAGARSIYNYHPQLDGEKINILWRFYSTGGGHRDLYFAYLNTTDGDMYDITGTNLGATITEAEATASCKFVDSGAFIMSHQTMRLDANGFPHVIYAVETGSAWEYNFTRWDGSVWTDPVTITDTDDNGNTADMILYSSTNIVAYLTTSGSAGRGGDIVEWTWDGVTWTEGTTLLSESNAGMPLISPKVPLNNDADLKVFFAEYGGVGVTGLNLFASDGTNMISPPDVDNNVYLDGLCQPDYGDVRFTSSDGSTLLDYWLEKNTTYAYFWVEVDSIPQSPANATIYIYYGKADATTTSDGEATFIDFDDFNDNSIDGDWTVDAHTGAETITETNQEIKFTHRVNAYDHLEQSMTTDNVVVRAKVKREDEIAEVSWAIGVSIYFNPYDYAQLYLYDDGANDRKIGGGRDKNQVYSADASAAQKWTVDNYKYLRMRLTATTLYYDYGDDGESWTNLASTARPPTWDTPTLTMIGHGMERSAGSYPNTNLDNSVGVPGASINTYADDYLVRQYRFSEPLVHDWGSRETVVAPPSGASNAVHGDYSIDNWDGIALYTDLGQDHAIFTFNVEEPDGASTITLFEFRFQTSDEVWHTFEYDPAEEGNMPQWSPWTHATGAMWVVTGSYWPLGNDGEGDARIDGTSWQVDHMTTVWENAAMTTNIEMYGRVTSGGQITDWTLLDGPVWHILDDEVDDDGGGSGGPPSTGGDDGEDDGPPPVYIEPTEPAGDIDGDGIPDDEDSDIDGDGIDNDRDRDMDGDGISNGDDDDLDGDGIPNGNDWGPYDPSDRRSGAQTYGIQIGRSVYAVESIWIRQNGSSVIILLLVLAFLMWTQDDETKEKKLAPKKRKRANGKSLLEALGK